MTDTTEEAKEQHQYLFAFNLTNLIFFFFQNVLGPEHGILGCIYTEHFLHTIVGYCKQYIMPRNIPRI